MSKESLEKKDIILFNTNQPIVHAMEMFGGVEFNPDDINPEEYSGWIKSIISDHEYLVATIAPMADFVCAVDQKDIIRKMDLSELTEDEIQGIHEFYMPPHVYENKLKEAEKDKPVKDLCCDIARKAVSTLFPERKIEEVRFTSSRFLKEDIIRDMYKTLNIYSGKKGNEYEELKKEADQIAEWFKTLRFKEYYSVNVFVTDPEEDKRMAELYGDEFGGEWRHNYLVTIDKYFNEVSIQRNGEERSDFIISLGGDYDKLDSVQSGFMNKIFEFKK